MHKRAKCKNSGCKLYSIWKAFKLKEDYKTYIIETIFLSFLLLRQWKTIVNFLRFLHQMDFYIFIAVGHKFDFNKIIAG